MKKLLVICGPTAMGKTKLALKLAQKFNGHLISADSRQVYKGMDIGTGKDHPPTANIFLIDVVNPNKSFTVANYIQLAGEMMEKIWKKDMLPILVGGSGFYIKGVVDGIGTIGIPPDLELRKKLEKHSLARLQKLLKEVNLDRWQKMNQSDRNNPRRLTRAVEIVLARGKRTTNKKIAKRVEKPEVLLIGLTVANKVLYQRIDQRVEERVKKGMVNEIKDLLKKRYSWENSVLGETLGYKEWKFFFKEKLSLEEVVQLWKHGEHAYGRRQKTWFKKDKRIKWFDITEPGFEKKLVELVKKWYRVV